MDRLLSYDSMLPITRNDLHALLAYYCNPALPILPLNNSQCINDVTTPAQIRV